MFFSVRLANLLFLYVLTDDKLKIMSSTYIQYHNIRITVKIGAKFKY